MKNKLRRLSLFIVTAASVTFLLSLDVTALAPPKNVLDQSNLREEYECYPQLGPGMNITCRDDTSDIVLVKELLYDKRINATENTTDCVIQNRHHCSESFSDSQLSEYYNQCSASKKCSPAVVWGQFKEQTCLNLLTSDIVFARYFCFSDDYNVPISGQVTCDKQTEIFLRYKETGTAGGEYKCLAETSGSTGMVIQAIDIRLNQTATSANAIGNCSNEAAEKHTLVFSNGIAASDVTYTCMENKFQFNEVYRTTEQRFKFTLTLVGGLSIQSVWLRIKSENPDDSLYISCGSSVSLSDDICHPTTTVPPTTTTDTPTTTTTTTTTPSTTTTAETSIPGETTEPDVSTTPGSTSPETTTPDGSAEEREKEARMASQGRDRTGVIVGATIAGLFVLIIVVIIIWCSIRHSKRKTEERPMHSNSFTRNGPVPIAIVGPPPQKMRIPSYKLANIVEIDDETTPAKSTQNAIKKPEISTTDALSSPNSTGYTPPAPSNERIYSEIDNEPEMDTKPHILNHDSSHMADKARVVDDSNIYAKVRKSSSKKHVDSPKDNETKPHFVRPSQDARQDAEVAETLREFDDAVNEEQRRSQWVSVDVQDPSAGRPTAVVKHPTGPNVSSPVKGKFVSKISI